MADDGKVINSFLMLCDDSLSKEARKIRSSLTNCGSGEFKVQTIQQVPLVMNYDQFEDKLKHLLTTWSEAVIVLTSKNFAAFIDDKKTENLPELLKANHLQSQKVLEDFFTSDSRNVRSKVIAITVNGDTALPRCLSHVQPVIKDDKMKKEAFVNKIRGLMTGTSNSSS